MTWKESVLEALYNGWIDAVRRKLADTRYTIRFTPRKPTSIWSAVNIASIEQLIAEGRVRRGPGSRRGPPALGARRSGAS